MAAALAAGTIVSTWFAVDARQARDDAVAALEAETEALAAEKKAKNEAIRAHREARRAVDNYVETVGESELLREERFKPLLKRLLRDALGYYESFIEENKDNPAALSALARACMVVGRINTISGDPQQAMQCYHNAAAVLAKLTQQNPAVVLYD